MSPESKVGVQAASQNETLGGSRWMSFADNNSDLSIEFTTHHVTPIRDRGIVHEAEAGKYLRRLQSACRYLPKRSETKSQDPLSEALGTENLGMSFAKSIANHTHHGRVVTPQAGYPALNISPRNPASDPHVISTKAQGQARYSDLAHINYINALRYLSTYCSPSHFICTQSYSND